MLFLKLCHDNISKSFPEAARGNLSVSLHHCRQTSFGVSLWTDCISDAVLSHGPLGTCPLSRAAWIWSYRRPAWYSSVEVRFLQDWSLKEPLNTSEIEELTDIHLVSWACVPNCCIAAGTERVAFFSTSFLWKYHGLEAGRPSSSRSLGWESSHLIQDICLFPKVVDRGNRLAVWCLSIN